MMGPLGPLSPHPGVSYVFSGNETNLDGMDASLWSIATGSLHGNTTLGSPPPPWTPVMGEMFIKIDSKLKV